MSWLSYFLFWLVSCVPLVTDASKPLKRYRTGLGNYDDAMDVADFSVYYDIKTNETIRKMMPRPWYRPGWYLRLPFKGGPCTCEGLQCKCCTGIRIQTFNYDRQTCVSLNYDPADSFINMEVKMSNKSVYQNTFSCTFNLTSKAFVKIKLLITHGHSKGALIVREQLSRNPPPLCIPIPVPYLPPGLVDMCVRLFDISIVEQKLHVCMDMDTRLDKAPVIILHFDCMDMGAGGVGLSKPGSGSGSNSQTNLSADTTSGTTTEQIQFDSDVFDPVTENTETTSKSPFKFSIKYI